MSLQIYDTSSELNFERYLSGIKLSRPNQSVQSIQRPASVKDVLGLSMNIYFLCANGLMKLVNNPTAIRAGFTSTKEAVNKTVFDIYNKQSAATIIEKDSRVKNFKRSQFFEDECLRKDGMAQTFLTVKCPWFNDANQVIGIFGASILLDEDKLSASLNSIMQLGILIPSLKSLNFEHLISKRKIEGKYFTMREYVTLSYLVKGLTAKQIAIEMGISPRTVEHYIEKIKHKMGLTSKYEVIIQLSKYFETTLP